MTGLLMLLQRLPQQLLFCLRDSVPLKNLLINNPLKGQPIFNLCRLTCFNGNRVSSYNMCSGYRLRRKLRALTHLRSLTVRR
ncbi:hypothetical protein QWZ13_03725 [Reinekea marina]|uniref:hypothetical protein n=1 Tax=Reinekea marina TaxID=1310421 RepID=UPI0025B2AD54|nr:hypothetical protein [Reinekea marina]MDN3648011.1 hypothetical protein [Reinekea marina]